jgi:hypothetical protein
VPNKAESDYLVHESFKTIRLHGQYEVQSYKVIEYKTIG